MSQGLFTGLSTLDVAFLGVFALAVIAAAASATIFLVSAIWSQRVARADRRDRIAISKGRPIHPETRPAGRPQSRGP